jgi:hypothetical protein
MANQVKVSLYVQENGLASIENFDHFLKLGATNVDPGTDMVPGDFTEATGSGYADIRIKGKNTSAAPSQIEGLTRAAACVVTWTTHGMRSGDKVTFADISQADWTALNGEHTITYLNANTFSIAVNTSAYAGDYVPATDAGTIEETTDCAWTEEFSNHPIDIILAQQSVTVTGPLTTNGTVYLWYLQRTDNSAVDAYFVFDSTWTPAAGGGTLTFTPRIQAGNSASAPV